MKRINLVISPSLDIFNPIPNDIKMYHQQQNGGGQYVCLFVGQDSSLEYFFEGKSIFPLDITTNDIQIGAKIPKMHMAAFEDYNSFPMEQKFDGTYFLRVGNKWKYFSFDEKEDCFICDSEEVVISLERMKEDRTYPFYLHTGEFLGNVTYFEFLQLRVKCKQKSISGCTLHLDNQVVYIDDDGRLLRKVDDGTFGELLPHLFISGADDFLIELM